MKPGATASPFASITLHRLITIQLTDRDDTIVLDADVCLDRISARAVVNGPVFDENVELILLRLRPEKGRNNQ